MAYTVGDRVKITATFTDSTGANVDPAAVTAKYTTPTGVATTLVFGVDAALVKDGVGIYHWYISLNAAGLWAYRAAGTGTHVVAAEGSLDVSPSLF